MKVRVKENHKSDVLIPFKASKGDIVSGEERPTKWKGWLYCTSKDDLNGWVPKSFLEKMNEEQKLFKFNCSYNAFELEVFIGEYVEIKETESGWALVINEIGKEGWVPLDNLDLDK